MKKSLFITLLLCFSGALLANNGSEQKAKGAHPYKTAENENVAQSFSHWSLTPHIGFSVFDGDFRSELKHPVGLPSAGLDVEYSFTPVWGLGLNYTFDMYQVKGKSGEHNANTLLDGHLHKAAAYLSMDFINLFYPKAKRKIFSLQAVVGAGYAWFKNKKMYHDDPTVNPTWTRGHTDEYINEDGEKAPSSSSGYEGEAYLQAGLNFEFNLNRTVALGLRGTYNYFFTDRTDGRGYSGPYATASKNNDGIADVTLNLRFKLAAVSKTHVRNISNLDTWTKPQYITTQETIYIQQRDTVFIREKAAPTTSTAAMFVDQDNSQNTYVYYLYFGKGKSSLSERGLVTVQQIADRMQEDGDLYAVVIGYSDNTGSADLNYALCDKRAESVADELASEYGIPRDHIYSMGMGKIIGQRSQGAYGPNRRAVIRLVDKSTFDRLKEELKDKRAEREEENND